MPDDLLEYALGYSKAGWKIHPCKPDKTPYLPMWQKRATADMEQIRKWWRKWPDASIGCATGTASGIWVLDADLPEGPAEAEKMNLPETLKQQTGGGGCQYFFNCNGGEIRNSAGKIGRGLDVRGNGGYVILPPSSHPSGNRYAWLNRAKITDAPEELVRKAAKLDEPQVDHPATGSTTKYGEAALAREIIRLSATSEGTRNDTLNHSAFALGQLVAGGELDEATTRTALLSTAMALGLGKKEASSTIASGLKAGKENPRSADKTDKTDKTDRTDKKDTNGHPTDTQRTLNGHSTDKTDTSGRRFEGNLTDEIEQYCKENQGSFTNADIDREFGLTHRRDKKNRSQALASMERKLIIKRDVRVAGKWHILATSVEWIDLLNISEEYFPVHLPLGLSSMVRIPPHSIVVVAGSSNAGKTTVVMNMLQENLNQPYGRVYLMSEMGPSEYRQRIQKLAGASLEEWQGKVRSASLSAGFDGLIIQNNRDGMTIVDFLEESEGEYFKITSDIRRIYDALGDGIAVVCLQKHSKATVGRGGEGTMEKARLYLTVDTLAHQPGSTISAVRIIKAKDYPGDNPNGLERHIEIRNGSEMTPISKWMYCNAVQREKWRLHYEKMLQSGQEAAPDGEPAMYFTTDAGREVKIIENDLKLWRKNFPNIDVDGELMKISRDSKKKAFLKDQGYFHQLAGLLRKADKAAGQEVFEV